VTARIDTIPALRQRLAAPGPSTVIGLVPTMGALHAGHVRLIETARRECGVVVVSIFVNPLQFDRDDDLRRYPRMLEADLAICEDERVDVVFAPAAREMYPGKVDCTVDVGHLGDHLCGRFRPGHFRGVATVVLKLFGIVAPHRAYFGEKDAQQLAIIRKMTADFNVRIAVVEVATVRAPDGLALSSRNRHLSPLEREAAPGVYRALSEAQRRIAAGDVDVEEVKAAAAALLPPASLMRLEYLEIVGPMDMQPVAVLDGPVRVMAAMWAGSTRLIDNVLAVPPVTGLR
jgi:pantoate--beta-alanine ligase